MHSRNKELAFIRADHKIFANNAVTGLYSMCFKNYELLKMMVQIKIAF